MIKILSFDIIYATTHRDSTRNKGFIDGILLVDMIHQKFLMDD